MFMLLQTEVLCKNKWKNSGTSRKKKTKKQTKKNQKEPKQQQN